MKARGPRCITAGNPSAMTLDGTRSYLVGREAVLVIDPGPADPTHIEALADAVGAARVVAILATHGHPDHAAALAPLAERLGVSARPGPPADGETFQTDEGAVRAVATPGHTPDHVAFHWPAAGAVFVGDLFMGGQPSTMVAAPEGDLEAYLESLDRVRALDATTLYPAHGPDIRDPGRTIDVYVRHRMDRLDQVRGALASGERTVPGVVDVVYGDLEPGLRGAATGATEAYLRYLAARGEVEEGAGGWRLR